VEKSLADTDEPCCFTEARNMCWKKAGSRVEVERGLKSG
jgi:hypothetical protein